MRRVLWFVLGLLAAALTGTFTALPRYVDADLNRVVPAGDSAGGTGVRADAAALHATLRIADLHDDLLLWSLRDPLERHERGQTDLPRLLAGNVTLQVFSTVSKTPRGQNYERNDGDTDNVTLLAITQRWPVATWTSLYARAVRAARALDDVAARSDGRLRVVRTRADLDAGLAARETGAPLVLGVLSLEGLQVLEGRLDRVDSLAALGFRMGGLTHFFDNEVGGSAHGVSKAGLTPLGRDVVARMERVGLLVDVAHASPALIDDVLAMATRPVVVSHTGVAATCPGPRNLTDDQLRRIAATGGVVGIGYWDGAVCEITPASIARAIAHAVQVAGEDHVALGSDWDGAVTTSFDASELARVTSALLDAGLSRDVIAKVMGENVLGLLARTLPGDPVVQP
jgi:microsomal dipeptidase-like Zn-dependent dipeptidase